MTLAMTQPAPGFSEADVLSFEVDLAEVTAEMPAMVRLDEAREPARASEEGAVPSAPAPAQLDESRLSLLRQSAQVLREGIEPREMLHALFHDIHELLGVDAYFNFMVNEQGDALALTSYAGVSDEEARAFERLEFGQAIGGNVALKRAPIVATEIQNSNDRRVQLVKSCGIRSYACNPLMSGESLVGTLSFASRTRDEFSAQDLEFFRTITHAVGIACERLRLVGQLARIERELEDMSRPPQAAAQQELIESAAITPIAEASIAGEADLEATVPEVDLFAAPISGISEPEAVADQPTISDISVPESAVAEALPSEVPEPEVIAAEAVASDVSVAESAAAEALLCAVSESEVAAAEAMTSDESASESVAAEALLSGVSEPEVVGAEAVTSDVSASEIAIADAPAADASAPEVALAPAPIPEMPALEIVGTDAPIFHAPEPDIAAADAPSPEVPALEIAPADTPIFEISAIELVPDDAPTFEVAVLELDSDAPTVEVRALEISASEAPTLEVVALEMPAADERSSTPDSDEDVSFTYVPPL